MKQGKFIPSSYVYFSYGMPFERIWMKAVCFHQYQNFLFKLASFISYNMPYETIWINAICFHQFQNFLCTIFHHLIHYVSFQNPSRKFYFQVPSNHQIICLEGYKQIYELFQLFSTTIWSSNKSLLVSD